MNKQRGGTLLGLIIGALLGLAAALAVAVYITKVPVPFMNKANPRNPDGDAAETRKNKDWNPNAALAGKHPPKTPPPDVTATPAPPAAVVIGPKSAASAPSKVAKVPVPAPVDPLGEMARSRIDTPASSGSTTDPFTYFIQAGAFRTPEDAEQQRARLLLLGIQAKVSEREQSGRVVYRVRLGPFEKKEDADRAKDRLDNNSIETALVRVQR